MLGIREIHTHYPQQPTTQSVANSIAQTEKIEVTIMSKSIPSLDWIICSALLFACITAHSYPVSTGFPADGIFNAKGIIQTPFGSFFTGNGRSEYCPIVETGITSLPPFGSTYEMSGQTLLFDVATPNGPSVATILALNHSVHGTQPTPNAFPASGIDTFISTFHGIQILVTAGGMAGLVLNLPDLVDPAQQVSRGQPYFDSGPAIDDISVLPLPIGSLLPNVVRDSDIDFFISSLNENFAQSIQLEIIALDARSADGQYRIISGQQMLSEYPDLFAPSFGIVVSRAPEPGTALLVISALGIVILLRKRARGFIS